MTNENTEESMVGEPSFGNGPKVKRNWDNANWTIKADQPNVYRILPPFATLAKTGKWAFYEAVIWGFKGTNGKQRPFRSIQQKNKGMITQADPAVQWIEKHVAQRTKMIESLKAEGKTKEQIEKATEPLTEFTQQFRVDKFFTVNALRPDGTVGKLKLKISAKKAYDALCKMMLEEEGVNPIAASEGVWVDFRKTGEGLQTSYIANAVYDVEVQGTRKVKVLRPAVLTAETLEKMKTDAFDLTKSFKDLTFDQIDSLVKSSGDPEVVDSIFGAPVTAPTPVKDVPTYDETSAGDDDEEVDVVALTSKGKKASAMKDFLEDVPF